MAVAVGTCAQMGLSCGKCVEIVADGWVDGLGGCLNELSWMNCRLDGLYLGELSIGRIISWMNCPFEELSFGGILFGRVYNWKNFPFGELSLERFIFG